MSVLFAYPGQGAQRPGMLAALPDEPPVRACLEQAADCLGQAPAELESAEALRGTRAVQLCLLIAGVAASRLLETRGHRPGLVAGLSIGAYPAAVVAGALDFDDALRLVALRGELMQAAWPEGYGMSAILGLEQAQLEALILAVRREHPPLYLANVNAERQLVVAGSEAALAALAERARAAGASAAKRLAVSVPSHCALLDEPAARLAEDFAGWSHYRQLFAAILAEWPDARFVGDSTQTVYSGNHLVDLDEPRRWFNASTGYGTLGYGLPAAIGAKLGEPGRPVVSLMGDGGLQFTLPELASAVEAKVGIVVLLWNNHGYGEIKRYMERREITPLGVDIYTPDFLAIARGFGCAAERARDLEHLRELLRGAPADRPLIVEVLQAAPFHP